MIDLESVLKESHRRNSVTVYNSDEVQFRPFAFVLNVKEVRGPKGVEVAPGYRLRRAQKGEIEYIKHFLTREFGRASSTSIWETLPKASGKQPDLPKKLWRYFVIEFANDDPQLDLLEAALTAAPVGLDIGFVKLRLNVTGVVRPACLYRSPSLFQSISALEYAAGRRDERLKSIGKSGGAEIREIFLRMAAHEKAILDLSGVIELLLELKDLPNFSPMQVLGYFAVLESILTHQPDPDDKYESITRQITRKLALLDSRWKPSLDYSSFGSATHEKIWAKMYAYRSAIAHGRRPDFKNQLVLLKSADKANELIRDTVKKAICHAYAEPQLISDLHNV